jgi:CubicO group peptidase (beta-lactamase class C family)
MMRIKPMRKLLAILLIALSGSLCRGEALPRSTPEAEGVSSAGIQSFVDAVDQHVESMNSFMLLRHGHVVAEGWWAPYRADAPHSLYSLSKSFTSTAVGLAISEGKLSLDKC